MVLCIKAISDRSDSFLLFIEADANNTFFDLHEVLMEAMGQELSELSSFFLADEEWDKGDEIALIPDSSPQPKEKLVMKETKLGAILCQLEDKVIYQLDMREQESLYLELVALYPYKNLQTPLVSSAQGVLHSPIGSSKGDNDLLNNSDQAIQNSFTDFAELEDLNLIYGDFREVV